MSKRLQTAELSWQAGSPESDRFGDIYFNRDGGIAETEYVFLQANHLEDRFAALSQPHFVIAETGFGTGLNFLCARQLWLKTTSAPQQLHFISCEKYPLAVGDLTKALEAFPQFSDGASQLIDAYPAPVEGFYTLRFDGGRVLLTLLFGDASSQLPQLEAKVDSWFLDGFAPAKNPDLWTEALFHQIARLSRPGTRFATFTAAGLVRRGLQDVGFEVEKRPGFGRKREMLAGIMRASETDPALTSRHSDILPIWSRPPDPQPATKPVIIIGAGLAGASTARALAEKGIQVQVLDRHSAPAQEGSGNPQGALYAKLPAKPTAHSRFHLSGLEYSCGLLNPLMRQQPALGELCGVLQLALNAKELERQTDIIRGDAYPESLAQAVTQAEASQLSGIETPAPGLFFPKAGWVSPPELCQILLDHPLISCQFDTEVSDLVFRDGRWQLLGTEHSASQVVVCCATGSRNFTPLNWLPLKPIRGQTSQADAPETEAALKTVVCGEGYISPPFAKRYCFGASFKVGDTELDVRADEHQHNLDILARALPKLGEALASTKLDGRVAQRCSTPDYLPLAGPAPDFEAYIQNYAKLRDDARWPLDALPAYHTGLFINLGHGSKGLITGPITGELLAALIAGTPLPLAAEQLRILHPGRFIIKNLIRGSL
ncbi:bifunctional tRNA (5-methylaminomethyl-2-thiouridine)(34)-methyltransferase MnmD/FAD-dependent 5-carboxymethylaminomethyl-2-thiouridine(34) oxidoreductase MnmC [Nitrincola sp.]|uniref:bifunctional tRNA (5-methylaminomethyl-2-thiouridine)(34)-methyltransferase MnmD/FAD-dependent 5-carboxymethylaminomethyl-2-thiouridine(34) oxidoreductase MnmC n=1 Tax=Nitrincola sp. TaxID=1926584 RepID=UPI003A950463